MHAATPRLGMQGTIFSEHELFQNCYHFYSFDNFAKNVKIMKKISVLITKYLICINFLVSNTINILIYNVKFNIK